MAGMRLAVLSDVHSNLEALDAVLRNAAADRVVVLGDLVGYGADPAAVVERLRDASATLLAGNHDLAATGRFDLEWFNRVAAEALVWTVEHAGDAVLEELSRLSPVLRDGDRILVHGSVRDPAAEYLRDVAGATASFAAEQFTFGFYGHTHVPFFYEQDGGAVQGRIPRDGDSLVLEAGTRYLMNPGSVGQPRDGDARASCLLVEDGVVTWQRVDYDVQAAQRKIRAAGLPEVLADRLSVGR